MGNPQQQLAELVDQTQEAFATSAQTWAESVGRLARVLPELAEQAPKPVQWVDLVFDYYEQALSIQRQIARTVVQAWTPTVTSVVHGVAEGTSLAAENFAIGSADLAKEFAELAELGTQSTTAPVRKTKVAAEAAGTNGNSRS